jgi:hypothetical protein
MEELGHHAFARPQAGCFDDAGVADSAFASPSGLSKAATSKLMWGTYVPPLVLLFIFMLGKALRDALHTESLKSASSFQVCLVMAVATACNVNGADFRIGTL